MGAVGKRKEKGLSGTEGCSCGVRLAGEFSWDEKVLWVYLYIKEQMSESARNREQLRQYSLELLQTAAQKLAGINGETLDCILEFSPGLLRKIFLPRPGAYRFACPQQDAYIAPSPYASENIVRIRDTAPEKYARALRRLDMRCKLHRVPAS